MKKNLIRISQFILIKNFWKNSWKTEIISKGQKTMNKWNDRE